MGLHQKMILAPRMIQSMEILQLPVMALQERIQQELEENPVLELREKPALELTQPEPEPHSEPAGPAESPAKNGLDAEFDRLDDLSKDWEDHLDADHRPSRNGLSDEADKKHEAMQNMPARPQSLQEYLLEQVGFFNVSARLEGMVRFLISQLDENGYITTPLEELARSYGKDATADEMDEALALVQQLDPPGIGARNLRECLLLQLAPDTPRRELLRLLIDNHLEDIQHNRLPVIQRRTGFDLATIKEAIEELRKLNPRPGAGFAEQAPGYIVPDILVTQDDKGAYQVRLVDDYIPEIHISKRYIEMFKDRQADPKAREFLSRKIQAAKWLKEAIEQRRRTLEKVTRAIIEHQKEFLEKGPEHIVPLKMQQIADQVGVHVTTVSRAVDDKWVQTPRGLLPLRRFFGGGVTTAEGEQVAYETIKQKLLEVIDKEDKANPYSDDELVVKLGESGCPVARRTVTKYRKLLNIPSSRQRKDWTLASQAHAKPSNLSSS